jgi:tetratricopeptide (TPR) repeat protein
MYEALVDLERRTGRRKEALEAARQGVAALAEADQIIMRLTLGDLLIDHGEVERAVEVVTELRKDPRVAPAPLQYLQARLLMHNGEWVQAAHLLDEARSSLAASTLLSINVNIYLGQCYERLGDPDQQLAACRRAVALNRLWIPARLSLAATQANLGALDEALQEYQLLAGNVPAVRPLIARLLIQKNLRLAEENRDWDPVLDVLKAAEQDTPDAVELSLLTARVLAEQKQFDRAREVLEGAREKHPTEVSCWTALASLAQRQELWQKSQDILDEAQRALGDTAALRQAQAQHWSRLGGPPALAALARLGQDLDRFPRAEREGIQEALVSAYLGIGERAQAQELLVQLTADRPHDLRSRVNLFDVAFGAGADEVVERVIDELRRIEGASGTWWRYCDAMRLLGMMRKRGDRSGATEFRSHLRELSSRRPTWSRVPLLEAELAELERNTDLAIEKYKLVMELGDRRPEVVRRLVDLLQLQGRSAEVEAALRNLPEDVPLRGRLAQAAAVLALRKGDSRRALDIARSAVAGSTNPVEHLWLAEMLWNTGQRDQAEQVLKQAIRLDERNPEPWVALVSHQVALKRLAEAEATIEQARDVLPADQRAFTLARCYENIGQRDQAEKLYQEAITARPDDLAVLQGTAGFYMRCGQPRKAEPYFRKLLAHRRVPDELIAWARRSLAMALASSKEPAKLFEAETLIDQNLKAYANRPEDRRAKAMLLSGKPARRQEAIDALQGLLRAGAATDGDRLLLAQLSEAAGNWPQAKEQFLTVLTSPGGDNAASLAHFISGLVRHGESMNALEWLDRLGKLEPDSARTLEVKVQVLKAQDRKDEAIDLLRKAGTLRPEVLAPLFEQLGAKADAETMYRRYVAEAKHPESVFPLIGFLGRQKRFPEALGLCQRAWTTCTPDLAARASVAVLAEEGAGEEHFRTVEKWLEAAIQKDLRNGELWLQRATLSYLRGDYKQAVDDYRAVLARNSRDPTALNNLAWILAMHGEDLSQARSFIERAIGELGPRSDLLATRGIIRLRQGENAAAIQDLKQVSASDGTPSVYMHLAHAYLMVPDLDQARDAWRKARIAGLDPDRLDPLERPTYLQLLRKLN